MCYGLSAEVSERKFVFRPLRHTHQDTAMASLSLPGTANPYKVSRISADTLGSVAPFQPILSVPVRLLLHQRFRKADGSCPTM